MQNSTRPRLRARALLVMIALIGSSVPLFAALPAEAAPCSTAAQSTCTTTTTTTVAPGTLGVSAPASLNWYFIQSGHDQVQSGSSAALASGSCSAGTGGITSCSGGVAPLVQVTDASGSGSGWALSAYVTGANLPTGTTLTFNGQGTSAPGVSAVGTAVSTAVPASRCDSGSSCTLPVAATTCSHTSSPNLGFSTCPSYPTGNLLNYTSSTGQVDLYSAAAGSGLGAICFGSTSPSGAGCVGTTPTAFFNMAMSSAAVAGSYSGAVINLTATTGP